MNRAQRWLSIAGCGLALGIGLLPGDARAQRRDEPFGRVGNVQVLRVLESGRFDRCYGMVPGFQLGARLFWNGRSDYILTVPGINPPGDKAVTINVPGNAIAARGRTDGGQGRTVIVLNGRQVEQFIRTRGSFQVDVQGTQFPFTLSGATMEQVFRAVEECVFRNSR
jgi:hypothetical protein